MAPNNAVFQHYTARLEQHNTIMKLINLKVLLFAALCTPFAVTAQTCAVQSANNAAGFEKDGDCDILESGPEFVELLIVGNGTVNLETFTDLRGVTIRFLQSATAEFSPNTFIDSETEFKSDNGNQGHLAIDGENGKLTFNGNGNGNGLNIPTINEQMAECPEGTACTLIDRQNTFVMPVTLMSWMTQIDGKQVTLDWETADEQDNSHFVVSRSTDGATFTELGTINGRGTTGSVSTYRFRDQKPATGVNYYRLEQYDYDGTRTELGVQSVDFGGRVTGNLMLSPNPVASGQVLTFAGHADGDAKIEIFAPNGSLVGNYLVQGGTFRVPTLKPGMYTLRMNGQASRLVVAR